MVLPVYRKYTAGLSLRGFYAKIYFALYAGKAVMRNPIYSKNGNAKLARRAAAGKAAAIGILSLRNGTGERG